MKLDDQAIMSALRGAQSVDDICRTAGVGVAEFAAARDAFLKRRAVIPNQAVTGHVGAQVEILRDRAGVPHVYAASTDDLYLGLGVAMAQDRLWQMDRLRRRALGRQAEVLGHAFVAADLAHLTVGIAEICDREPALMDPQTLAIVTAFAAGINRQIELYGRDLPIEFAMLGYAPEPFTVRDISAIARGLWWSLNGRIDRIVAAEAARLLPPGLRERYLTPEASENLVLPTTGMADTAAAHAHAAGTDDATGSNNWAIAGSRATGGKPVLCGDPHQPFWVPSSWYEFALHGPEDDCAGAGPPGSPGLWWGSNGTAAWAITNNMATTRDLYREDVDPADSSQYREGAGWKKFSEREVSIAVRGEAPQLRKIRSTVRGPVVNALIPPLNEGGDPPLSLRWVGMEHLDDIRAMIGIGRARSWPAFRHALRDWSVAVFNFVYADAGGTIGYQMAGKIPLRGRVTSGFRDAANPLDQWTGYIPFDDMPTSENPARGYVASANQRIVGDDYKYPIYGAYSQGHRGVRLDQALGGRGRIDLTANVALQNDVKSSRAQRSVPHLLRHLGGAVPEFAAALSAWDFHYAETSIAPTLFETFMAIWNRVVQSLHLPERLLDLTVQQTGLAVAVLEDEVKDYFPGGTPAMVAKVGQQALDTLTARLGADRGGWQWGKLHTAHWRHPLTTAGVATGLESLFDIGPAPVDGGSHTIRNTGGELPPHAASSGAEYRIVVDFTAPDSFQAVQNIGNSGIPGSPHYQDQFVPWLRGTYHTVHLKRAAVERELASTTVIKPA